METIQYNAALVMTSAVRGFQGKAKSWIRFGDPITTCIENFAVSTKY